MMDIEIQNVLMAVFNWSEVWALLIPLFVLYRLKRHQPEYLRPVITYLWIALVINLTADSIADLKSSIPWFPRGNLVFYNIHSIIRFVCFSYFFTLLLPQSFKALKNTLPVIFILFLTINFSIVENFLEKGHISGNLHAAESYLLLIYCMSYYLSELKEDRKFQTSGKDFMVVTGLSIYVVTNFFVFLFYVPLLDENLKLAIDMWYVHNVAYVVLCIFIARSFYVNA
ncbi:hypothetical protein GZH53_06260 [Flavihumibacter sp. R14]|nr:hypothetical protein [Flavihumibacter soli]